MCLSCLDTVGPDLLSRAQSLQTPKMQGGGDGGVGEVGCVCVCVFLKGGKVQVFFATRMLLLGVVDGRGRLGRMLFNVR